MRRLLTFPCEGAELAASLDGTGGRTGLLLVTGGSQTRIGSHRMYEQLAKSLARLGYPCLRYDRRGVGDSAGEDPGFRGSGPDLKAAAALFRAQSPGLVRIVGLGLCDGATALALFGAEAKLDGLILVNPWLVETESDEPAPAAIRAHYRKRLFSLDGWKKLLSGAVDYRKLLRGIAKISTRQEEASLAQETASALARSRRRAWAIFAANDATAIAAEHALEAPAFRGLVEGRETIRTDSHTFAREGDEVALLTAVVRAIEALSA